jgi:hypothetical protein
MSDRVVPAGLPTAQNAPPPASYATAPVAPKSPLQKVAEMARSIALPGSKSDTTNSAAPTSRGPADAKARSRPTLWY